MFVKKKKLRIVNINLKITEIKQAKKYLLLPKPILSLYLKNRDFFLYIMLFLLYNKL